MLDILKSVGTVFGTSSPQLLKEQVAKYVCCFALSGTLIFVVLVVAVLLLSAARGKKEEKVNMVFNVHRNHKTY